MTDLKSRLEKLQNQINQLCKTCKTNQPQILAVSKTQPVDKIVELYNQGHRYFGENYAQELSIKAKELCHLDITWSFIGQIQSNKIKSIVQSADEIQSVASLKHARMIAKFASELGKTPYPVFISVNAEMEESKGGIALTELPAFADELAMLRELNIRGIMCIPPQKYSDSLTSTPPLYTTLKQVACQTGDGLLSLGMSRDMRLAIEAETNIVRIGTALFGPRNQ